ncbi:MAG: hypothetical protein IJM14_11010 [Lachnospiraceae bacterium]|nr:hypothetical protein [Lachnospiraceae bacterium]
MCRIKHIVLSLLLVLFLLTACSEKEKILPEEEIFEIENAVNIEQDLKQVVKQNDCFNQYELREHITSDGENFYFASEDYHLDIKTNKKKINCDRVGCTHEDERCFIRLFDNCFCVTCYNGGFLAVRGNKLLFIAEGNESILLENKKHSEAAEEYKETDPNYISQYIFLNEKTLFVTGRNFGFTFDLEKKIQGNLIAIGEANAFYSISKLNEDSVILSNSDNELFFVDVRTTNVKKLGDHVVRSRVFDSYVYMVEYVQGERRLYKLNPQNMEKTFILEDVGYYYYVLPDDSIIFTYIGNDGVLFLMNNDGEIVEKLDFGEDSDKKEYKLRGIYDYSFFDELYLYVETDKNGASDLDRENGFIVITRDFKYICKYGNVSDVSFLNIKAVNGEL